MNEFKGMNKQYSLSKAQPGTWEFARNILLSDKYTSIANERGSKQIDELPGINIGEIITNSHIVYFNTDLEYSYIIVKNLNEAIPFYNIILKTKYLNFQIDCPIEGVHYYNYKNELVVGWVDGIFDNSNPPYLINLDNLPFEIDDDKELIKEEDINKAKWFPDYVEPYHEVDYTEGNSLIADVIYYGFTYCLEDDTEVGWSTFDNILYIKAGLDKPFYKNAILTLTNFDSRYTKFKIGLVVKHNNTTTAYKSKVPLNIEETVVHTITNLRDYEQTSPEALVFETMNIRKAHTVTLENDNVYFGNYKEGEGIDDDLQKYVNLLELGLVRKRIEKGRDYRTRINDTTDYETGKTKLLLENLPSLLPNEVYSFRIKAMKSDGNYTPAFHIPNNLVEQATFITPGFGDFFGISELKHEDVRVHHILNTGKALSKIDEHTYEYSYGSYFGKENYPNTDSYNSTDLGGEDLRGTPVRHHRIPSFREMSLNTKLANVNFTEEEDTFFFVPYIKNLEDVFPQEILDSYEYFTLEIVKRTKGNSIVDDTIIDLAFTAVTVDMDDDSHVYKSIQINGYPSYYTAPNYNNPFGVSESFSYNIIKNTPTIPKNSLSYSEGIISIGHTFEHYYKNEGTTNNTKLSTILYDYPTKGLVGFNDRFSIIKSYRYFKENDVHNQTRFAENFLQLSRTGTRYNYNTSDIGADYYYNPLRNQYDYQEANQTATTLTYDIYNSFNFFSETITNDNFNPINFNQKYQVIFPLPTFNYALLSQIVKYTNIVYPNLTEVVETVTIGKVYHKIENSTKLLYGGDVFTNTKIDIKVSTIYQSGTDDIVGIEYIGMYMLPFLIYGIYSTSNNAVVKAEKVYNVFEHKVGIGNSLSLVNFYVLSSESALNRLNATPFKIEALTNLEGDSSSLNDLVTSFTYEHTKKYYIEDFPFRIAKSDTIGAESLTTSNIRQIKTDNYYDMPNDKGPILALRSLNRKLYIQQVYSLFLSEVKDRIESNNNESTVYLGTGALLDRQPMEIVQNGDLGYIGCQSKFACKIFRDGLVIVDMVQGKVFIVSDNVKEVSINFMRNYYKDNLDTHIINKRYIDKGFSRVDNPYLGIGISVAFDNEFERLIITKQQYDNKTEIRGLDMSANYDYNGEVFIAKDRKSILPLVEPYFENNSETLSISTEVLNTICNHDYIPNNYHFTTQDVLYIKNDFKRLKTRVFKLNSTEVPKGYHDGEIVESYVDLIFNKRLDLSKLYQSVLWSTEVEEVDNTVLYNKTIDKIMLYNDYQCSGIIDLSKNDLKVHRNIEGVWQFNEFRDLLVDSGFPITNNKGLLNESNINKSKPFYEKSNFISTFIVVRVYFKNDVGYTTYLNNINVKSIISKR